MELLRCIPLLLFLLFVCGLDHFIFSILSVIQHHSFVQYSYQSELTALEGRPMVPPCPSAMQGPSQPSSPQPALCLWKVPDLKGHSKLRVPDQRDVIRGCLFVPSPFLTNMGELCFSLLGVKLWAGESRGICAAAAWDAGYEGLCVRAKGWREGWQRER